MPFPTLSAERIEKAVLFEANKKYLDHRLGSARRGVAFEMSFEEWWAWWLEDGRWNHRGHMPDDLCMARIGDTGPYSIDNVYCCTNRQNNNHAIKNLGLLTVGFAKRQRDREIARRLKLLIDGT